LWTASLFFAKALRLKEKADRRDDPALGLKKNHRAYLGIEISLEDLVNKRKTGSVEMLNNQLNAHGFHPRRCGSSECDSPNVIRFHRFKRRGGRGGTGTVPSVIVPVFYVSYHRKRNSPEPKKSFFSVMSLKYPTRH